MTQFEPYNPLESPSPEQLAHRLAALSAETRVDDGVPFETGSNSPTLSPDQLHLSDLANTKPAPAGYPDNSLVGDAIRAIYRLWSSSEPEGDNHETFIELVRQSIHTS